MGAKPLKGMIAPERQSGIFPRPIRPIHPLISDSSDFLTIARNFFDEKKYDQAESFLKRQLAEDPFNTEAAALLIRTYSRTGKTFEAKSLFQNSMVFAEGAVYTAYIDFCCHHKRPYDAYNYEGVEILEEARSKGAATPEAFALLIDYFGSNGKGTISQQLYDNSDGYRDAGVYCAYISSCCMLREPWKAEWALDRAQNEGILSPKMFKNLVKHYSDYKRAGDARRIFDWAIARDQVDTELCSMMMRGYLYGESNVHGAREIFDIALQRGNASQHLCMLLATGYIDSHMHESAEEIFNIAQNSGMADSDLAILVMRSYTCSGKKQQALDFFNANIEYLALELEAQWYHSLATKTR